MSKQGARSALRTATLVTVLDRRAWPRCPALGRSGITRRTYEWADSGNGTLNVEAGGVVTNSTGWIGTGSSSTGLATVTGIGSQWSSSRDLEVGSSHGHGTLNVEAGGVVSSGFSNIALFGTGAATVTGSGSKWNNSDNLSVGRYSDGTLNVEAGGVVNSLRGLIGRNSFGSGFAHRVGTGVATVTGAGSQWNISDSLSVGSGGHATLNVEAGGVVSNTVGYIGEIPVPTAPDSTAVATVTGSGSQWNNSLGLYLGGNDAAAGGDGHAQRSSTTGWSAWLPPSRSGGQGRSISMVALFRQGRLITRTVAHSTSSAARSMSASSTAI